MSTNNIVHMFDAHTSIVHHGLTGKSLKICEPGYFLNCGNANKEVAQWLKQRSLINERDEVWVMS